MKRFNLFVLFLVVCPMFAFGQLKVTPNGETTASKNIYIGNSSNFLGTTSTSIPVVFKTGSILAGNTGSSGSSNVIFGYNALNSNTTGNYNTAVGVSSLRFNMTGNYNTAIGYNTGSFSLTLFGLANTTSIGSNVYCTASNQVRIGDNTITSIGGYVGWSTVSDGRAKKNIRSEVPGLDFINLLQPITYNLDLETLDEIQKPDDPKINRFSDSLRLARTPKEIEIETEARANKEKQVYSGFIAQDVEKAAQSLDYDFSGVDAPQNDKTAYGLRYAEFVVPLVKAVQELSEQNNRLQEQINELTAKLNELTNAPKSANAGVINESEAANNFSFSLFPNPTSGIVTVDYTLHVDAPICIELYNMFGQTMKMIVPRQNQKAGIYSVQISVGDLGVGTYLVKATSGNQVESKQLVVNN